MSARIVFAGSPAVATHYLRALSESEFDIVGVISREDAPVGRKRVMTPTPVSQVSADLGIPVITANSLVDVSIPECDLGVVVAYGGMVPDRLLTQPRLGWINVHFSELPAYRGAAPLQRALWDGRESTGVSIFRLVRELDAGPLYFSRPVPFLPSENATDALDRVARETTSDLVETVRTILVGKAEAHPQGNNVSFAPKFSRDECRVNWSLASDVIATRIRAVTAEPGAFTTWEGQPFGIVTAAPSREGALAGGEVSESNGRILVGCGDGSLELVRVKPPGKSVMTAGDWWRGVRGSVRFE